MRVDSSLPYRTNAETYPRFLHLTFSYWPLASLVLGCAFTVRQQLALHDTRTFAQDDGVHRIH